MLGSQISEIDSLTLQGSLYLVSIRYEKMMFSTINNHCKCLVYNHTFPEYLISTLPHPCRIYRLLNIPTCVSDSSPISKLPDKLP